MPGSQKDIGTSDSALNSQNFFNRTESFKKLAAVVTGAALQQCDINSLEQQLNLTNFRIIIKFGKQNS